MRTEVEGCELRLNRSHVTWFACRPAQCSESRYCTASGRCMIRTLADESESESCNLGQRCRWWTLRGVTANLNWSETLSHHTSTSSKQLKDNESRKFFNLKCGTACTTFSKLTSQGASCMVYSLSTVAVATCVEHWALHSNTDSN